MTTIRNPGHDGRQRRSNATRDHATERQRCGRSIEVAKMVGVCAEAREEFCGYHTHAQPQQVLYLTEKYAHRYSRGEPGNDRLRHVFHERAESQQAGPDEHQSREQGAQQQSTVAKPFDHVENDRNEGRGWPSNLHP